MSTFIPTHVYCQATISDPVIATEAIHQLVNNYQQAREHGDSLQLLKLLVSDADQLVSSGEWRRGKSALVKGMQRSTQSNPGQRSITVEHIRFISESVAIADARYIIAGDEPGSDRRMWSTFIVQLKDEEWKIAGIRNMLPAAPRN